MGVLQGLLKVHLQMDEKRKKRRSIEEIIARSEDYRREQVRLTKEKADKMALANDLTRGKLLYKADVEETWAEVITTIRAQLLTLPAKYAPQLAIAISPIQVNVILTEAIDDILKELQQNKKVEESCDA